MHIHGPSQVHGLKGPHISPSSSPRANRPSATPTDSLDISPAAQAAASAAESSEIRSDLVARVRSEISSGTYETPEKLDAALSRLLDEIS
ncbi:MAG: flagellar biosynthesis anti-sigma factor FlgM [Planctomycetales bacterium]|nr:flagellar biosynthesis anti-sigma factor FlgM [Planctomycetales bacterium]